MEEGGKILNSIIALQGRLTELVIKEEMRSMDVELGEVDAHTGDEKDVIDAQIIEDKKKDKKSKSSKNKSNKKEISKLIKEIEKLNSDLLRLEVRVYIYQFPIWSCTGISYIFMRILMAISD